MTCIRNPSDLTSPQPATDGKVIIDTTAGEIEVGNSSFRELWLRKTKLKQHCRSSYGAKRLRKPSETSWRCQWRVRLCRQNTADVLGYYDGVIFHRIVPGFIVQTGDPTGIGTGGESFYGEMFEDEIHGRLRFNRRGLIGMANNSKRNTNTSQFFITLDRADELTGKHTMFGKITGNTIFSG